MSNLKKIALSLFLIGYTTIAQAQCAMCRASLETEDSGNKAEGINNGIVYLMVFPYILFIVIAFAIYRVMKKNNIKSKN